MLVIAERHLDSSIEYEKLVIQTLKATLGIDEALESGADGWFLSEAPLNKLEKSVTFLNMCLTELGQRTHEHLALWNFTIKNHSLAHIALQAPLLSPRVSWNYSQESFLQHIRRVVVSCRSQPSWWQLQRAAMKKYFCSFEAVRGGRTLL